MDEFAQGLLVLSQVEQLGRSHIEAHGTSRLNVVLHLPSAELKREFSIVWERQRNTLPDKNYNSRCRTYIDERGSLIEEPVRASDIRDVQHGACSVVNGLKENEIWTLDAIEREQGSLEGEEDS